MRKIKNREFRKINHTFNRVSVEKSTFSPYAGEKLHNKNPKFTHLSQQYLLKHVSTVKFMCWTEELHISRHPSFRYSEKLGHPNNQKEK